MTANAIGRKVTFAFILASIYCFAFSSLHAQQPAQVNVEQIVDAFASKEPEAQLKARLMLDALFIDDVIRFIPDLAEAQTSNEIVRRRAADQALHTIFLRLIRRPDQIEQVLILLRTGNQNVWNFISDVIAEYGETAAPLLLEIVFNKDSEEEQTRWRAAHVFSRMKTLRDSEIESLNTIFVANSPHFERDEWVKFWIALALAERGRKSKEIYSALTTKLNYPDTLIQMRAAVAIESLGSSFIEAPAVLIDSLERNTKDYQTALNRYRQNEAGLVGSAESTYTFATEVADNYCRNNLVNIALTRAALIRSIAHLPNEQARLEPIVLSAFHEQPYNVICHIENCGTFGMDFIWSSSGLSILPAFKGLGSTAVKVLLTDYGKNPDGRLRRAVVIALGFLGESARDAIPQLLTDLNDKTLDRLIRGDVVEALGNIGSAEPLTVIPALTAVHKSRAARLDIAAATALETIAEKLAYKDSTDSIAVLQKAKEELDTSDVEPVQKSSSRIGLAIKTLSNAWWKENVTDRVTSYGLLIILPTLYAALIGGLYFLYPLGLLRLHADILKRITDVLPAWLGSKLLSILGIVTLMLQYRPRVLDAWVDKHFKVASRNFLKLKTVDNRSFHVPNPVIKDGRIVSNTDVETLQPVFAAKISRLLIQGEGGAGKTSLACQIAKWAMHVDPDERLCPHRMLPILIEEEFSTSLPQGKRLIEHIRRQLRELIGDPEPIPAELVEKLLRHRRILVIVDRFSEMSVASRDEIQLGQPDFPINALIVTSRNNESLGSISTIEPYRIEGNRLSSFMEAYLTFYRQRTGFADPEFFDHCGRLTRIIGDRKTTPLLIILYARQMIADKAGTFPQEMPENVPDLMLRYLSTLNASISLDLKPSNRDVHRDSKALAWHCLKDILKPHAILRDQALEALGGEQPEDRLAYLENRLRIVETIGAAENQVRFTMDPIAEYLAALHLVEMLGHDENGWEKFFVDHEKAGSSSESNAFVGVLRDCAAIAGINTASFQTAMN
jgi:HEAT repeat protein